MCLLAPSASSPPGCNSLSREEPRFLHSTKALSAPEKLKLQARNPILGNREGLDGKALGDKDRVWFFPKAAAPAQDQGQRQPHRLPANQGSLSKVRVGSQIFDSPSDYAAHQCLIS